MDIASQTPALLTIDRRKRLIDELNIAIRSTPRKDLEAWAGRIPGLMGSITLRRGKNFGVLAGAIAGFFKEEGKSLWGAGKQGRLVDHLGERVDRSKRSTVEAIASAKNLALTLTQNIKNNPDREGSRLAASVFGFVLGSGGIDGNGGVPDLDFLGGIGAHRSIFTHSIISGVVIETIVLSVCELTTIIHKYLPADHDPLWEEIVDDGTEVLLSLSQGVSAGIAYHMGIDATLDGGGTFKDLPVSLPQEAHQVILGGSAVVEGSDAVKRSVARNERLQDPTGTVYPSFKEAAEVAKKNPKLKITRSQVGDGFLVKL